MRSQGPYELVVPTTGRRSHRTFDEVSDGWTSSPPISVVVGGPESSVPLLESRRGVGTIPVHPFKLQRKGGGF